MHTLCMLACMQANKEAVQMFSVQPQLEIRSESVPDCGSEPRHPVCKRVLKSDIGRAGLWLFQNWRSQLRPLYT